MSAKETLLQGYEVMKAREAERIRLEQEVADLKLRTRLARVLIMSAESKVPRTHSGVTLDLPRGGGKKLIKTFGLPSDYPANELKLKIRNDYDSWANFSPYINIPGQELISLPFFLASSLGFSHNKANESIESPTYLFIAHGGDSADLVPVEYGSEDYGYILNMGDIFLNGIKRAIDI